MFFKVKQDAVRQQEMPGVAVKVKYVRVIISISLWSVNFVILWPLGIVYIARYAEDEALAKKKSNRKSHRRAIQ